MAYNYSGGGGGGGGGFTSQGFDQPSGQFQQFGQQHGAGMAGQQPQQDDWFGQGGQQQQQQPEQQQQHMDHQMAPPQQQQQGYAPQGGGFGVPQHEGFGGQQPSQAQQAGMFAQSAFTSLGFQAAPAPGAAPMDGGARAPVNFDDEPPLLEELGINFAHIRTKTVAVLVPTRKIEADILHDTDMAGPLVFCLVQGFCLMFSGKLFFGYVFGFGVLGCISMYTVVNLMNHESDAAIDIYRVVSVLGYCLLPIVVLSGVTVLFDLRGVVGNSLSLLAILWCTQTATRFFEAATGMREQRYLIAYPVFLLYAVFALITVY